MMDELWREEEKKTLESIAKLTELGKVKWECVEYNPLCFMNEDKVDETSAYLCQMFTLTAEIGGMPYELEIAEYITVPDGKGDIALTLTRDVPDDFMKIDSILSSDVDEYENCEPSEIGKRYKNDPAMRLTETIVPVVIESEAVQAMKDIPVRMISYGGSNYNISFLVRREDKVKALRSLSHYLFENK